MSNERGFALQLEYRHSVAHDGEAVDECGNVECWMAFDVMRDLLEDGLVAESL